jgi:hypothetical protein
MSGGIGSGLSFAAIFEQQIQSLRVSYYAESVRNEHQYGPQIKIRDEKIAELQSMVKDRQARILALEKGEVDRLVTARTHRDKVQAVQRYIKGLQTDHEKFKKTTKAHQDECSTLMRNQIIGLQNEKAALERDLLHAVGALENSRRSTKHVLDECYTNLVVSESKRLGLMEALQTQTLRFEEERKRCQELEHQVARSLQTIQRHLEEQHCTLLEKLSDIQTSVDNDAAETKRDARLQQCIDALNELKSAPRLTIDDVRRAEGMLRHTNHTYV